MMPVARKARAALKIDVVVESDLLDGRTPDAAARRAVGGSRRDAVNTAAGACYRADR